MIITRTPYRVSFFGGGTDYHTWYQEYGGAVLATTIDHYSYLTCRFLPPFFEHKNRVVWREIEEVKSYDEIKHPAVRAILEYLNIERGVEIHHHGGLPARSGLGSSSTFTVGLLHALYALRGLMSSKKNLACEAVHIEREVLKENVGVQDQISAAYGGLNKIDILPNGDFNVHPVILPQNRLQKLQNHMMLFFTGVVRTASDIAGEQVKATKSKKADLHEMRKMVDIGLEILTSGQDLKDFGKLLHESWMIKRGLTSKVAPDFVDDIYSRARKAGAIGGKLLGAGGGGFMLFFVEPEKQEAVMNELSDLLLVPFGFDTAGSQIISYEPARFSRSSLLRRNFMHLDGGSNIDEETKEDDLLDDDISELSRRRKTRLTIVS